MAVSDIVRRYVEQRFSLQAAHLTTPEFLRACLALLSGRRHQVLTALVLVAPDGAVSERVCASSVTFARLAPAQLDAYAASGEVPKFETPVASRDLERSTS